MPSRSKKLQVPERRALKLPYPQLSAREALSFVKDAISEVGPHWFLGNLAAAGNLGLDGCLLASPNSAWQLFYCQEGRNDFVSGYLFSDGTLSFRVATTSPEIQPSAIKGSWLDSREIAEILMAEPDLSDLSEAKTLWMALRAADDGNPFWAIYRDTHQSATKQRARTTFGVDALTGEILSEGYERWDHDVKVRSLLRQRWKGADWTEAEDDGGRATDRPSSVH